MFVAIHSPNFLNSVKPEGVFWLAKKGGYTQIHAARNNQTVTSPYENGDPLGYLWQQRYFQGSDPKYSNLNI